MPRLLYFGTVLSILGLIGCTSLLTTQRTFTDIQSLESQVRNYRAWIHENDKELKSLNLILKPILESSLRSDFPHFEQVDKELTAMNNSFSAINEIARGQKKLILRVQPARNLTLSSTIPGESVSFLDKFIANDREIHDQQERYRESKDLLIKIFKKKNRKLIFLQDQIRSWTPAIKLLQTKREKFIPRIEKQTEMIAAELTYSPSKKTVEALAKQSQKIESISSQLDRIEDFFENIIHLAAKEIGGYVYLGLIGDPPKVYEQRFKDRVDRYTELLQRLDRILPE